jgi:N-acetylneuraminic acid mutarotase
MVSDMIMRSSKHSARRAVAFIALYGTAMSWILLPGLAAPSQTDSKKSNGTWTRKASIPTQRFEVGVTALDGKIYVLGGEAFGRPASGLNEEYDPATNRWRELAPIPHETSHVGAAGFNGKIYAIGGFTAVPEIGALDLAFEYDIAKDTWRKLPPLSSPRGSVGVAVVDGTVHVIGGRGLDRVTVATHEIYDPVTGHWTKGAPLPTARDHLGAVVFDGKIHIIGGRTSGSTDNTNFHDVYDPATDSWRSAAPLLTARSSGAAVLYHGFILYVGGECKRRNSDGGGEAFSENEAYDPKTDRWQTLSPVPGGRHGFGAASVGPYAYFAAGSLGCGGGPRSDEMLAFNLP